MEKQSIVSTKFGQTYDKWGDKPSLTLMTGRKPSLTVFNISFPLMIAMDVRYAVWDITRCSKYGISGTTYLLSG